VTSGGSDAGGSDADGGTVVASGSVKTLATLAGWPASGVTGPAGLTVSASSMSGSEVTATTDGSGNFSLTGFVVASPYTWFELKSASTVETVAGFGFPSSTGTYGSLVIPQWTGDVVVAAASACNLGTATAGTGTLVLTVVDGTGTRVKGAKASGFRASTGPCYDDGTDVTATAIATGALGTVAFFGISPSAVPSPVSVTSGTATGSINPPIVADAVTYAVLAVY
jgi:hypothetical protein